MRQVLRLVHWENLEGVGGEGGGRGGSGWGTHVNPWLFHFSVLQNPLQIKKKIKKIKNYKFEKKNTARQNTVQRKWNR